MTCNGVCPRYKASKPLSLSRYLLGQKRCNFCNIYINWDGLYCPCCNMRLRHHPRNRIYKEKLFQASAKKN